MTAPWVLPRSLAIGGREYAVSWDFRDILQITAILQDENEEEQVRMLAGLTLFYDDFAEMPPDCWQEAAQEMFRFFNLGEEETQARPSPKRLDWEQDYQMIAAEVNKAAGCEVRLLPALHWWTFIGYFNSIGEGQLATVCAIRDKLRRGKPLDSWEREFYAENKARVDMKTRYTQEELAEQAELLKLLGEG